MKLLHVVLCVTLIALFALADGARDWGHHAFGAALDVCKLLVCATLLVAAWRSGLRLLAVVGVLLFSVTACAPLEGSSATQLLHNRTLLGKSIGAER